MNLVSDSYELLKNEIREGSPSNPKSVKRLKMETYRLLEFLSMQKPVES